MEAFILTGGRSTRMGRDKATLELNGFPLAERAAGVLRASSLFSLVRFVGESRDANFVADIYKTRGPLGGLHAALSSAKSEWIFLLGCDLPFVTRELIARLATFCLADLDTVVPVQDDGQVQPLCAFYRVAECFTHATDLLESSENAGLRDLLERVQTRKVAFDQIGDLDGAEHFFLNINTPDDLETARAMHE